MALACGEPSPAKVLRSITAKEVTWWQAYEMVNGPIGSGPLLRALSLLIWMQCDSKKTSPEHVLDWLLSFVNDPYPEPVTDGTEEEREERQDELYEKMKSLFPVPDK